MSRMAIASPNLVRKPFVPSVRKPHDDRDGRRGDQRQDQRVGELAHHPQDDALARRLAELVGAVFSESGRRVLAREPLGWVDLERCEQRVDLFGERGTRRELRLGSAGDESVVAQCAIRVGAGGRGAERRTATTPTEAPWRPKGSALGASRLPPAPGANPPRAGRQLRAYTGPLRGTAPPSRAGFPVGLR